MILWLAWLMTSPAPVGGELTVRIAAPSDELFVVIRETGLELRTDPLPAPGATARTPLRRLVIPVAPPEGGSAASLAPCGTRTGDTDVVTVGETWVWQSGEVATLLDLPRTVRQPAQAEILGCSGGVVWIAAPGIVASLALNDESRGLLDVRRVATDHDLPQLLSLRETLIVAAGAGLFECEPGRGCAELWRLPGRVELAATGEEGWLVGTSGGEPGLYRGGRGVPLHRLVPGKVVSLALVGDTAWAVIDHEGSQAIIAASLRTPAIRAFEPGELLAFAMRESPQWPNADTAAVVLEAALTQQWPLLEDLALRAADESRAALRCVAARMLAEVRSARGVAALWLLARDPDRDVRAAALQSAGAQCEPEPRICVSLLSRFSDDPEPELAWPARDQMVRLDAGAGLRGAPSEYKLDLLSRLTLRIERQGPLLPPELVLLSRDDDPQVRALAETIIDHVSP